MRVHQFAGIWALLVLPVVGWAQVAGTGPILSARSTATPGGATSVHSNDTSTNTSNGNTVSLTEVGDLSYQLSRGPQKAIFNFGQYLPFFTGPIPVQMTNLTLTFNLKKVNGGGTDTNPATTWLIGANVYEQLGGSPNPASDPQILGVGQTGSLTGNGFKIITDSVNAGTSKYVLGAGTNYYLYLSDATTVDNTAFKATDPTVGFTNEYGGDLTNGTFTGYAASFQWQAVPEPGSATMVAGCAMVLLHWNRRGWKFN